MRAPPQNPPRHKATAEGLSKNTRPTNNVLNTSVIKKKESAASKRCTRVKHPRIAQHESHTQVKKKNTTSSVTSRTGPCWHWSCWGQECQVACQPPRRLSASRVCRRVARNLPPTAEVISIGRARGAEHQVVPSASTSVTPRRSHACSRELSQSGRSRCCLQHDVPSCLYASASFRLFNGYVVATGRKKQNGRAERVQTSCHLPGAWKMSSTWSPRATAKRGREQRPGLPAHGPCQSPVGRTARQEAPATKNGPLTTDRMASSEASKS